MLAVDHTWGSGRDGKLVVWPLLGWSSVIAIVVGVRRNRPPSPRAWYLLAAGVATFVDGRQPLQLPQLRRSTPRRCSRRTSTSSTSRCTRCSSPVSCCWFARRSGGRDRASVIDAGIITGGVGLVVVGDPHRAATSASRTSACSSASPRSRIPLGDIALLAIAVRLAVGGGRRPLALLAAGRQHRSAPRRRRAYGYLNLAGTWHEHNLVDVGWIVFYVGWGAAALHPSMRAAVDRVDGPLAASTRRRLVLVGSAVLDPAGGAVRPAGDRVSRSTAPRSPIVERGDCSCS